MNYSDNKFYGRSGEEGGIPLSWVDRAVRMDVSGPRSQISGYTPDRGRAERGHCGNWLWHQ